MKATVKPHITHTYIMYIYISFQNKYNSDIIGSFAWFLVVNRM